MEACENYQKQSYRNRCRIYAADGVQSLNFPVRHVGGSINLPIREVLVDYSTPWLQKTKRCIDTAYHSSPFFDYYRDSLYSVLDSRPETLWDLDMAIIAYFMQKIGLNTEILPTGSYSAEPSGRVQTSMPQAKMWQSKLSQSSMSTSFNR